MPSLSDPGVQSQYVTEAMGICPPFSGRFLPSKRVMFVNISELLSNLADAAGIPRPGLVQLHDRNTAGGFQRSNWTLHINLESVDSEDEYFHNMTTLFHEMRHAEQCTLIVAFLMEGVPVNQLATLLLFSRTILEPEFSRSPTTVQRIMHVEERISRDIKTRYVHQTWRSYDNYKEALAWFADMTSAHGRTVRQTMATDAHVADTAAGGYVSQNTRDYMNLAYEKDAYAQQYKVKAQFKAARQVTDYSRVSELFEPETAPAQSKTLGGGRARRRPPPRKKG